MHLSDFVDWLNNRVGGEGLLPNINNGDYGEAMKDSLWRHYAEDRQKGGVRMSNLGKPAAVLALAHLGYSEPEPKGKSRFIFHMGDMFENWLEVMLKVYGIEILDSQPTLKWGGITGHADYIINSPVTGKPIVVEAKTMSDNYHRSFTREQNDDRGYLTQLALYSAASGYDSTWICLNKGTNEVTEIVPNTGVQVASLDRAQKVLARMQRVKTIDDVLEVFRVPPPRPEVYRREQSGRFILPSSLSYSVFKTALYKLTDDFNGYNKPTSYVLDVADTDHLKSEMQFLLDNGLVTKD